MLDADWQEELQKIMSGGGEFIAIDAAPDHR